MINRPNLAPTLTMSFLPISLRGVKWGQRIELLALRLRIGDLFQNLLPGY